MQGRVIALNHLHSHTGNEWNDVADHVANLASMGLLPPPVLPPEWAAFLLSPVFRWIWMLPAPATFHGLPDVGDVILGLASKAVEVGVPAPCPSPTRPPSDVVIGLRCASFNACTLGDDVQSKGGGLYQASVQSLLQAQCKERAVHIFGIQETRLPTASVYAVADFLVFNSAAEAGNYGCALWLAKSSVCSSDGQALPGIELRHCTVLMAEPRLLIVRVKAHAIAWLCVVAHAPHSGRPLAERTAWWSRLEEVYCSLHQQAEIPIVCIDSNARVGKSSCEHIGSHQPDPVSSNGELFTSFLRVADLFLPSTTCLHTGEGFTWTAPNGARSRLDFVALPRCLQPSVVSSWVWNSPDVLQPRPDHAAPVVDLRYTKTSVVSWAHTGARLNVAPESGHAWLMAVSQVPSFPWNLSVDSHSVALTKSLHTAARPFRVDKSRRSQRPFVGPAIRQALALRKHLRAQLAHCESHRTIACVSAFFQLWKAEIGFQKPTCADLRAAPIASFCPVLRACSSLPRLDVAIALHWRAFRQTAQLVKRLLRAAKTAYVDELGRALAQAAETFDAAAAYAALKSLVPAVRKRSSIAPAVPLLDVNGRPFGDHAARAAGWSDHFGHIEGGQSTTWESLRDRHVAHCRASRDLPSPGLQELPDRLEWERCFRGLAKRKAPGPDGLDNDSLHAAQQPVFRLSFALALKVASCHTEPLNWRGGDVIALYKGKGSGAQLGQYRSILLSNCFSKRWHGWLRRSLIPVFTEQKAPLQSGATGGVSTGALSLLLRTFQAHCREHRVSHALLFVDLKSAFYSIVRQFLLSKPVEDLNVLDLCSALHLEEYHAEALISMLGGQRDPEVMAIPRHLQCFLDDLLSNTWFEVRGAGFPVQTAKGSRPGDPLADLLFSFCIAAPLKALAEDMSKAGLRIALSTAGILPGVGVQSCLMPATASWHDDLVICVTSATAASLVRDCAYVARRTHDLFLGRGLMVNYEAGKSEAVCTPMGKGSREVLSWLRRPQGASIPFLPDNGPMQSMACVDAYRHLGSMLHDSGSLLVEIRRRRCLDAASQTGLPTARCFCGGQA